MADYDILKILETDFSLNWIYKIVVTQETELIRRQFEFFYITKSDIFVLGLKFQCRIFSGEEIWGAIC
jgi:hypothetical protein